MSRSSYLAFVKSWLPTVDNLRNLQLFSRVATAQEQKLWKTCEAARNIDADEDETGIKPYMLDRVPIVHLSAQGALN